MAEQRAGLRVERLTGAALAANLTAIAQLRIEVFREWPYLYDGDMQYESNYLRAYSEEGALCVAVWDGEHMVGASTGAPISQHEEDFSTALPTDWPLSETFYCAESVLLPKFRGRGLGHVFFDEREGQAKRSGFKRSVFASVLRPGDHSNRPSNYSSLDGFWRGRGYDPLPGAVARFAWKDVGEDEETEKPLQLWGRVL